MSSAPHAVLALIAMTGITVTDEQITGALTGFGVALCLAKLHPEYFHALSMSMEQAVGPPPEEVYEQLAAVIARYPVEALV